MPSFLTQAVIHQSEKLSSEWSVAGPQLEDTRERRGPSIYIKTNKKQIVNRKYIALSLHSALTNMKGVVIGCSLVCSSKINPEC